MMGDHPWRRLRELADWLLGWAHRPEGLLGLTDFVAKIILLDLRQNQIERRCALAHELEHVQCGPVPADPSWRPGKRP